jgi:hypothetical protein
MSKSIEILYQEHLSEMFSLNKIEDYSAEEIDRILDRILRCLPNKGKLYKYRSIDGDSFENAYDSLTNGYFWFSKACDLNDDEDTVLYYDPIKSVEEIQQYLEQHPVLLIKAMLDSPECQTKFGKTDFEECAFENVINCYNLKTGELIEEKALIELAKLNIERPQAIHYIRQIKRFVNTFIANNEESIKHLADLHMTYNDKLRDMSYIFSMSEDYDSNSMWAYYSNNNRGFCIAYDFQKARALPSEAKRKLISLYRVEYQEKQEDYSFIPLMEYYLGAKQDIQKIQSETYNMLTRLITKKIDWKHEKEWRLFLSNTENKQYIDLVSGIIIDERVLNTENAKRLIELSNKRGWSITVRRKNITTTKHIYEKMEQAK